MYGIRVWQSEPHKKDQNFAKRGWQMVEYNNAIKAIDKFSPKGFVDGSHYVE